MDRQGINTRFIEVFELLEKNDVIIRNDRERGLSALSRKLFGNKSYGHVLNAILKGERHIPIEKAMVFCELFDVNENYILKNSGPVFGHEAPSDFDTPESNPKQICFLKDQAAAAGPSVGVSIARKWSGEYFSLPGLHGSGYIAFPVEGASMEPVIFSGDILVCQEINNWDLIKDNDIYAVACEDRVYVKYIQKIYGRRQGKKVVVKLKLLSANYLENDPIFEEVTPQTHIYKVIKRLQDFN